MTLDNEYSIALLARPGVLKCSRPHCPEAAVYRCSTRYRRWRVLESWRRPRLRAQWPTRHLCYCPRHAQQWAEPRGLGLPEVVAQ